MSRIGSRLGFRPADYGDGYPDTERGDGRRVPPVDDYYEGGSLPSTFSKKAKKYPNFTDLNRPRQDEVPRQEKKTRRQRLAEEFAETTTLQGIAYIHRSKKWYRAGFWLLVFLAAVGATVFQTYSVFEKYYSYRTTTSVGMGYAKLPFPTVTICNINPIRKSASAQFSKKLADFIESIEPKVDYANRASDGNNNRAKRQISCDPFDWKCFLGQTDYSGFGSDATVPHPDGNDETEANGSAPAGAAGPPAATTPATGRAATTTTTSSRDKTSATRRTTAMMDFDDMFMMSGCNILDERCRFVTSPCSDDDEACKAKYPSLYDDVGFDSEFNFTSTYEKYDKYFENDYDSGDGGDDTDDDADSDYGTGQVARSLIVSERLKEILSDLSRDDRRKLGHQPGTMILHCEFNGRKCYYWNTVFHLSGDYGNCYSFNSVLKRSTPYRARNSGPTFGFTAILYIESHDYIPYLSQGKGMRIVIHPFNTMPFAVQMGKSLKPGEETYIGIKMINMTRKGKPYGKCGDDGQFSSLYSYKYTVEGCINTCLPRAVYKRCGCYTDTEPELYNTLWSSKSKRCESEDQLKCVFKLRRLLEIGKLDCQCNEGCNTVEYNIEMSHNTWPDVSMWYELVDVVCERDDEACAALKKAGGHTDEQKKTVLRENFLRVHVYFQDLNFQTMEEKPEYELEQFLSDIGGTMGLWVGASIITVMELFYFTIWLLARCLKKDK